MELDDVINLSLFYRNKKGLKNFTPEEVISIGYHSFLLTEKLYNPKNGAKKTTFFMQLLEWNFREEFRKLSHVKIPKWAWNKGERTSSALLDKKEYEASKPYTPNYFFDEFELLLSTLNEIPQRQSFIIKHKYGLAGHKKLTFKKIAEKLNLSPQRTRVLHLKGIKRIKELLKLAKDNGGVESRE